MKNSCTRKLNFRLVFTALLFLSLSKVYGQRADAVPIIKYAVNNYATVSKACDTCLLYAGKPLIKGRPIPLPEVSAFDALTGIDPKYIPGIIAPNFIGGGSPEIKGLVKNVAGMTDRYAKRIRKSDILYFRYGTKGVAVTTTGKIVTASSTILPGVNFDDQNLQRGFFSFKSAPQRIPVFNSTSEQVFEQSSKQFIYEDGSEHTYNMEVIHFVIDPKNEKVVYASLRNPEATSAKVLAKKNPDNGNWEVLDWDVPGELDGQVWGSLAMDKDGHLYVADAVRHIIVKISFDDDGKVASRQIIGGQPDTPGFVNDEDGRDARFNKPSGICLDAAGNIYIGDAGNNRVRKIDTDGEVTTYAGGGEKGFEDDNEDWAKAKFWGPTAVAYNEKNKALYVVDFENKLIREIKEITDQTRGVSTLAGNAGSLDPTEPARFGMTLYYILAQLNMDPDESKLENPTGIAIDPSGYGLYVSDGLYIKYVSTFHAEFEVTGSYRSPDSKVPFVGKVLPFGLFMNPNNGTFFGVPTTTWEPTTYTIRATNSIDKSVINGFVTFEVLDCPDVPVTVTDSITISPKQLPYTWNGQVLNAAGTATVTLQTSLGCDSVVVLKLGVKPEFNYNCDPYLLSLGLAINPIVPAKTGARLDSFSVSPSLPAGLTLDAHTGAISGTPTAYTTSQLFAAVGPKTPPQYPVPWTLETYNGADLTQVQILDCNQKVYFENKTGFGSLQGSAGVGTGTAGAYSDFSALGPIKMSTNTPYTFRLANTLSGGYVSSLNTNFPQANYMNSYAVYIDYNRDGDFADAGERVYRSAAPQRDAHAEVFNLNIPATATSGVTKMRIYAVEAATWPTTYQFKDANGSLWDANGNLYTVNRTTEQALSFYPFFNDISYRGEQDFSFELNYGEFEDYNLEIENPVTQSYVIKGRNNLDSAEAIVKISVNDPTRSTTNATICSTELPYNWNGLSFGQAGTQTAKLKNRSGADSLATLNLVVKAATMSEITVAQCGTYNFHGQMLYASGFYWAKITNAAGCDSTIYLTFRQKATASQTDLTLLPNQLPFTWNGVVINTAGTYSAPFTNRENCDSTARLTLRVQYNIYYTTNNLLEINKPIVAIRPRIEGNYTPPGGGYFIFPALPGGLYFDPVTGVISGTPTQLSALGIYTVSLRQDGAQPTTFTLSVGMPTVSTTTIDNCGPLTWNGAKYDKAGTFMAHLKNQYGFDSTATLVLSMRNLSASTTNQFLSYSELPYNWNGDSIRKEGLDTVHFVNSVGCDSAAIANVVISPKINYVSPQILQPNQAIAPITPQNLGGKVINFTIQPALVKGLQFDVATGVIFGTPADTLIDPVTHIIRAFNGAGSDAAKLVIAVCNPIATSFTIDNCVQYVWNDSTYINSTTHTRTLKNRGGCDSVVTMHLIIRKASTGATTLATACGSYLWYGVTYDKTGIYTKVFPNAVGCDSTIYLNLTIKNLTVNNLYVNLNASDLPYPWRGKTFAVPGTQSILLVNSVGCDSTLSMTVRISDVLPDISYAIDDTVLYWEKRIETPITMTNTGTPVPILKLGERDTLIAFSNGPGDQIKTIKGPDGAYYARVFNSNKIYKLTSSGLWNDFANAGGAVQAMAMDKLGNLYVGINEIPTYVKKITPDGAVNNLPGLPYFFSIDGLVVDPDNNLVIQSQRTQNQFSITRFNLSTNQSVQTLMDNPYFDFGPEDMKTDSKGNIYMYRNVGGNLVKIKPDGHMSSIGRNETGFSYPFVPGNGIDARISAIASIAIDSTNDNVYVMANGRLLRVDTAENVTALTGPGRTFDQFKDQIFRVDSGKLSIVNSSTGILYTVNVYGVGSLPFMDNYGVSIVDIYGPTVNFKDFDKRIRLDSSGAIVGTPRKSAYLGNLYATNTTTAYTIVAANQYGISTAPMVITNKSISYKRESYVTTSLPFLWRGRSFTAATDTATYFVANKTDKDDTLYLLHLVYEGPPEPVITSNCVPGGVTLTATGAAKSSISFDGTNMGIIKNIEPNGNGGQLGFYNVDVINKPDGSTLVTFHSSFEVWIKPASVSGIQYLLTKDTVKTRGTFFGYSIQDGKFVYELSKGGTTFVDYKLSSAPIIKENEWTHVAASFYDSAMHIFINGKLEGTLQTDIRFHFLNYVDTTTGQTIWPDFFLAGLPGKSGYKGEMDELRLWGTRRNADSIKARMNTIVDPSSFRLGLYYRFDGDVSKGVSDVSSSGRTAKLFKPAISVASSGAPINFASYKWMPGGETTKSIVANPASNTLYTTTVTDYKGTPGSQSWLVYPLGKPAKVNCWDNYQLNTGTCTWVNIGTKPIEPAKVNCWDNYQFNTTSCTWVNTGTQPAKPTTQCYQTATFNTTTCKWDVTGTPVRAGTNGTLTVCEGTTLTTAQLFAALTGSPTAGGSWSPALAGAGTYTYTVAAKAPCTGNVTATVTVTTIKKTIDAGCFSATIARTYNTSANTTTFTYNACTNGCRHAVGYIAFITQTNIRVTSPLDGANYKTAKYSYKVSVPVGNENGKMVYGIKYESKGEGLKNKGECDNFTFTLAGNITADAITVRFKAGNEEISATAECPLNSSITQASITSATAVGDQLLAAPDKLMVSTFPNPYTDKVKFVIQSPVSGQASLEVFNMLGQKVQTVFEGHVEAGREQSIEYNVPYPVRGNLVYILRVGKQKATGKLIYPN